MISSDPYSNATICARESSSALLLTDSSHSENVNIPVVHATNNIKSPLPHSEMISWDIFTTPSTDIDLFTSKNQYKKDENLIANNAAHTVVTPSFENALNTNIFLSVSKTPALSLLITISEARTIETSSLEKQDRQTASMSSNFNISTDQERNMMTPTSLPRIYPAETSLPLQPSIQYVCVKNCPDGYYSNESSHKCLSCSDVCKNCSAIIDGDECNCSFTNGFDVLCRAEFKKSTKLIVVIMIITTIISMFLIAVVVIVGVQVVHKIRKRRKKMIAIKSLWKLNVRFTVNSY